MRLTRVLMASTPIGIKYHESGGSGRDRRGSILASMRYISDNGLTSRIHGHMLDGDLLFSAGPVSLQRLDLRRERAGRLLKALSALSCCSRVST
jgi:hypothetical protein